jgi:hypothetical protein
LGPFSGKGGYLHLTDVVQGWLVPGRNPLGANRVRVEVHVEGVMELPTVQMNEHASTNPSASNSVFSNLQG